MKFDILQMRPIIQYRYPMLYPITPLKGAAPLSGSIKDFTNFWKQNRQKRVHAPFFVALVFRYKTDIFPNKKKLHIDLKNKIR